MEHNKLRVATVFSGIGAAEEALRQLGIPHEIVFACDNGERNLKISKDDINGILSNFAKEDQEAVIRLLYRKTGKPNNVKRSYFANHEITEDRWYEDVRFLDGKKFENSIDLYIGGSPCQSFSTYGLKRGFEDTRGTLFYDYARLISEIKPKVFIFENVRGLLSHDSGKTWETIQQVFKSLNYDIAFQVLDAQHYGLPQMRKRLFVVGIRNNVPHNPFAFPQRIPLIKKVKDYLDPVVDDVYYLPEKGFKWVTDWERNDGKARVNRDIMGCQTAVQQFNWSGDFRIERPKPQHYKNPNIYIGKYNGEDAVARKLTPDECMRLMGFKDFKIVNDDHTAYRQAGNSIAVPVLKAIFLSLMDALDVQECQ